MTEIIGGITIPDTTLGRAVTEYIRETTNELLFHHSRRVFLFGTIQGQVRGLTADPELLYTGAMFHDVGLTDGYTDTQRRFEVESADAAAVFLLGQGLSPEDIRRVWLSVALHTTPGIPEFLDPEVALVTAGVETDVLGIDLHKLDQTSVDDVVTHHPRPDFKRRILHAFNDGNTGRPGSTFGNVNADVLAHFDPDFVRTDFVDVILESSWPE